MVVTELFAVISGKDDDRIIVKFLLDQGHDQTSDLVVQMRNAGIVADLGLAGQFRIQRSGFGIKDPAVLFQVLCRFPGADERLSQIFILIKIKVMGRRVKRRVRPQVGGHQEERLPGIPAPQKVKAPVGNPVGGMVFFFMRPGPCKKAVAVNAGIGNVGVCAQFLLKPVEIVVCYKLGFLIRNTGITGTVEITVMQVHIVEAQIIS